MKIRNVALLVVTTCLACGTAVAGLSVSQSVVVDFENRTAIGDMVTARYSDNDVELIGCGVRFFDDGLGGTFTIGFCSAADSENNQIVCFTESATLIDAIKSISSYSFITFAWNEDTQCTAIGNSTQSIYIPNVKTKK